MCAKLSITDCQHLKEVKGVGSVLMSLASFEALSLLLVLSLGSLLSDWWTVTASIVESACLKETK